MRRKMKLMAAVLVVTCTMTMTPQKAEASILGAITHLVGGREEPYVIVPPPPKAPLALVIGKEPARGFRVEVWTSDGQYERYNLNLEGQVTEIYGDSKAYALRLSVYDWDSKKYRVKDYVEVGPRANILIYKRARGDFRMSVMNLR